MMEFIFHLDLTRLKISANVKIIKLLTLPHLKLQIALEHATTNDGWKKNAAFA